jgi:N-acetylglucosaminyldiphosphoundecaprenol N-acetyl-beta-D-mannosaminyltransferase
VNAIVRLGRLSLAAMSTEEAAAWVVDRARRGDPAVVVTSNIHHLRLAENDPAFRDVVERAELNVADGWPLIAASRILGVGTLPERVAGVDLVHAVLRAPEQLRIAIIGGVPGAAEKLAGRVHEHHEVVLVDPLPRGSWEAEGAGSLAERLAVAKPTVTLLALGAPKQELLADTLRGAVAGPIICCGAAVEILAGVRPRAPRWVQRLGLEWAFRVALEPRRLAPRYATAVMALAATVIRELRSRRTG